jgi:hypothetical protein
MHCILGESGFLFEQSFKSRTGVGGSGLLLLAMFAERKELTEISGFLIKHWVGQRFAASIGVMGIVEGTVQAATQVGATARTHIAPPDAIFTDNLGLTVVTG